jgi:hypothetical protein
MRARRLIAHKRSLDALCRVEHDIATRQGPRRHATTYAKCAIHHFPKVRILSSGSSLSFLSKSSKRMPSSHDFGLAISHRVSVNTYPALICPCNGELRSFYEVHKSWAVGGNASWHDDVAFCKRYQCWPFSKTSSGLA